MIRLIQRELKMGGRGFTIRQDSVGETYQLHCHDFYEFFLVTKGRALHVVNEDVYKRQKYGRCLRSPQSYRQVSGILGRPSGNLPSAYHPLKTPECSARLRYARLQGL